MISLGAAIRTRPDPVRSAARATRAAAPIMVSDPAMTRTLPKSPLCASALRGGREGRGIVSIAGRLVKVAGGVKWEAARVTVSRAALWCVRLGGWSGAYGTVVT